jgi:predicted dienelactone hydrolase
VWYPAQNGAREQRIDLGPPGKPLFIVGASAPDAAFADAAPKPVVLFSHGYGGTARMMGWFGLALARAGYVVIAVDHPGNNGQDKMTIAGGSLFWDRVEDLRAAYDAAKADPVVGPHLDPGRVGVAGFSAGGFTALNAAGARVEMNGLFAFCRTHPKDGECVPQKEFALTMDGLQRALRSPALRKEAAHAGDDHAIPGVRGVFVIAPALVPALRQESLEAMKVPVSILLGGADPIATPENNGLIAAEFIPHAQLQVLPDVGHYDFLSTCTPAGKATPFCTATVPQDQTHQAAIQMALAFFGKTLAAPKRK